MSDYIILTNSNSSLIKKFFVAHENFKQRTIRMGRSEATVTGKVHKQTGPHIPFRSYYVFAYHTDPSDPNGTDSDVEGFGTLAHLKTFFDYNDADGTPSNEITLTDVDDSSFVVTIDNDWDPVRLSPSLTGLNAIALVKLEMKARQSD